MENSVNSSVLLNSTWPFPPLSQTTLDTSHPQPLQSNDDSMLGCKTCITIVQPLATELWIWRPNAACLSGKEAAPLCENAPKKEAVTTSPVLTPVHLSSCGIEKRIMTSIACTATGSFLVLDSEGCIYGFGENKYGELGLGHTEPISAPHLERIQIPCNDQCVVTRIFASDQSFFVLDALGSVWSSGRNALLPCAWATRFTDCKWLLESESLNGEIFPIKYITSSPSCGALITHRWELVMWDAQNRNHPQYVELFRNRLTLSVVVVPLPEYPDYALRSPFGNKRHFEKDDAKCIDRLVPNLIVALIETDVYIWRRGEYVTTTLAHIPATPCILNKIPPAESIAVSSIWAPCGGCILIVTQGGRLVAQSLVEPFHSESTKSRVISLPVDCDAPVLACIASPYAETMWIATRSGSLLRGHVGLPQLTPIIPEGLTTAHSESFCMRGVGWSGILVSRRHGNDTLRLNNTEGEKHDDASSLSRDLSRVINRAVCTTQTFEIDGQSVLVSSHLLTVRCPLVSTNESTLKQIHSVANHTSFVALLYYLHTDRFLWEDATQHDVSSRAPSEIASVAHEFSCTRRTFLGEDWYRLAALSALLRLKHLRDATSCSFQKHVHSMDDAAVVLLLNVTYPLRDCMQVARQTLLHYAKDHANHVQLSNAEPTVLLELAHLQPESNTSFIEKDETLLQRTICDDVPHNEGHPTKNNTLRGAMRTLLTTASSPVLHAYDVELHVYLDTGGRCPYVTFNTATEWTLAPPSSHMRIVRYVHAVVLAARSGVWNSQLYGMRCAVKQLRLPFPCAEESAVDALLSYLYCDELPLLTAREALQLTPAVHKLALGHTTDLWISHRFYQHCLVCITRSLSIYNVFELYTLAIRLRVPDNVVSLLVTYMGRNMTAMSTKGLLEEIPQPVLLNMIQAYAMASHV